MATIGDGLMRLVSPRPYCRSRRGRNGLGSETILAREMKREMTIQYLMCRADLNVEVDFGVNGAIGTIVIKWDLIVFE